MPLGAATATPARGAAWPVCIPSSELAEAQEAAEATEAREAAETKPFTIAEGAAEAAATSSQRGGV